MNNIKKNVVVIGSGPGGYSAAFRASDLGCKVTLIDKDNSLGGVCLNRGCIPSKAFLHISHLIEETKKSSDKGVTYNNPKIDIKKINNWKNNIVSNLTSGIKSLSKQRNINFINGEASFLSANKLLIKDQQNKVIKIDFDYCIIATGSVSSKPLNLDIENPHVINSKEALSPKEIPTKMLVVGGGYIGLELGSAYHSFGTDITIAEFSPTLLPMADKDLVQPLNNSLSKKFSNIYLSTEVLDLSYKDNNVIATFKNNERIFKDTFKKVLICTGRKPNTNLLSIEKTGIKLNDMGFIPVNSKLRTTIPNIYAIGDVAGNPMLAHKATHEGKCAAENIAGINKIFNPMTIPSVIYTNPEIAWAGYTEFELKNKNINYNKGVFPWAANGRALTSGSIDGKTKILSSEDNSKILGIGITGINAGELISEAVIAIEMGANIEDISLSIHPHPTLSETISNAAEILNKTITDLYIK